MRKKHGSIGALLVRTFAGGCGVDGNLRGSPPPLMFRFELKKCRVLTVVNWMSLFGDELRRRFVFARE